MSDASNDAVAQDLVLAYQREYPMILTPDCHPQELIDRVTRALAAAEARGVQRGMREGLERAAEVADEHYGDGNVGGTIRALIPDQTEDRDGA